MRKILVLVGFLSFIPLLIWGFIPQAALNVQHQKDKRTGAWAAKLFGVDRPFWAPNRIGDYITNNGQLVSHIPTGSSGMEWPVGSHKTINFASGIWLAGKKNGEVVAAAAEFITEFQPGSVAAWSPGIAGTPANPNDPRFKVYLINQIDLANPSGNPDYLNWPVGDGAPVDAGGKPLLLGTSTAWAVFNDFNDSLHTRLLSTKPMGIEVQMTAWAYNRRTSLGDMLFFKFKFINKSGKDIIEAFVAFWADIDIGDAVDLTGCDTTLSLGYMYKTRVDGLYGVNPPAIGYDFLQGPIVPSPGDTANVSGRKAPGFRNLPMFSFNKYIGGGPPQFSDPETGIEAYHYMRGFDKFGNPIIDPTTGKPTKFVHPGDPIAGTGWLDNNHSDKRFLMSSGPFILTDGDIQEVVCGIVIAQGNTGRESVKLLTSNDRLAQTAYDNNFVIPFPPSTPVVTEYPDTASILLVWDSATELYSSLDGVDGDSSGNVTRYTFQGYNVYQLDAPAITSETEIKKIASFDVIDGVKQIRDDVFVPEIGQVVNLIVQDASDNGVQRFLRITTDAFHEDTPLIRNQPYYFAVTAYGYNPFGFPKTLESPMRVLTARPQSPSLGSQLTAPISDTLAVSHTGPSQGDVLPIILAPGALTGHTYEVRFRNTATGVVYDVWDATTSARRDSTRTNQSDSAGAANYSIIDGVLIKVASAPIDFKDFLAVANAAGPLNPPEYAAFAFNASGFPHPTTGDRPAAAQQIGPGLWGVHTGAGGIAGDFTYTRFLQRVARNDNFSRIIPNDFEMRFTAAGGKGQMVFTTGIIVDVPFELWNIGLGTPNDPRDDYRMIPFVNDIDANDQFNLAKSDHPISGGDNDPETDWIFWMNPANTSPGSVGYNEFVASNGTAGIEGEVMARMVLVNFNGGSIADVGFPANVNQLMPEVGTVFRILSNKPNAPADVFSFTTTAPIRNDLPLARQQAAKLVNVFPNPYDRGLLNSDNPTAQFVTFTHLPEGFAKILIYTIAGDFVRRIDHTNATQFEHWDLRNAAGRQVGSGIYLVHIDMGEIGVKTLKVVVF